MEEPRCLENRAACSHHPVLGGENRSPQTLEDTWRAEILKFVSECHEQITGLPLHEELITNAEITAPAARTGRVDRRAHTLMDPGRVMMTSRLSLRGRHGRMELFAEKITELAQPTL